MINNQKEFFDRLAATEYDGERLRGESFAVDRVTDIVTDFVLDGLPAGGSLLEFGSGKGHWTLVFLQMGYRVTAADFSGKSLAVLKERAKTKGLSDYLTLVEADIEKPLFEDTFDRVFCVNTLHHVWRPSVVVKNMAKASCIGGKVSALEPNPLNPWWWLGAPIFDRFYNLGVEGGIIKCFPWRLKSYFLDSGLSRLEVTPLELFPAISPDRFGMIVDIERFLFKIPLVKSLSGLTLVGGWK